MEPAQELSAHIAGARPRRIWGQPGGKSHRRDTLAGRWCAWEPLEARRLFAAWDVALIDSTLARPELLAAAANSGTRIIYFDGANESAADVLQRVTKLADDTGWRVRTVSIFSHGSSGAFALGKDVVSAATLEQTADAWRDLGRVTVDDADIYLYGCSVTSEFSGQKLLTGIAELTGADVFGSNDLTGRGGDWDLETGSRGARRGRIVVFDLAKLGDYTATLAAPVVTMTGGTVAFTENGGAIVVDNGLTVSDADGGMMASATVTISGNFSSGNDVLSFTPGGGITGSYNATTGVLSLSGSGNVNQYRNVLRSVTFNNTSENPTTGNRTLSFVVNDGTSNSAAGTRQVTITAVNDAPVASTTGSTLAYTENGTTAVDTGYTVSDVDNANLASATVSIVAGFVSAEDTLAFTNQNGITGSYNSGTGVLTLTGSSSVANYQTALRSVTYNNSSDNPTTTNRTVRFVASDGALTTGSQDRVVSVAAVNDAPTITPDAGSLSYTENDGAIALSSGLNLTDPDNANIASATVTISANYVNGEDTLSFTNQGGITGSWNGGTGVLTLTGSATKATYQTALRSITYTNSSDNPSTAARTVSFAASDGTDTGTPTTRNIAITAANDAPTLTGTGGSVAHTEGTPVVVDGGVTVADVDNANIASAAVTISAGRVSGDTLNFTDQNGITGSYNSGTGVLTLSGSATLAHYQTALRSITFSTGDDPGTGTRTVSFVVNDGTANSNTVTRDVTVTPVNDAPVLSGIEGSALAFTEDDAATNITASIVVADPDNANLTGATIQISANYVNGEDTLSFTNTANITGSWNAGTGILTLSGTDTLANYQAALRAVKYANSAQRPTTAARTIAFTVTDGALSSNTVTRSVTVASINDAPFWTVPGGQTTNEDTARVFSSGNGNLISVADPDDGTGDLSITLTGTNGTITLAQTTGLTFSTGDGTADATMTFTGTSVNVNAALAGLSFTPTQDFNGAASLGVAVNDQGNTGSGGAQTDSESIAITVNAVNDAPVLGGIEGGSLAYTENDAATATTSTLVAADVDLGNLTGATVQITGNYQNGQDVLAFTDANGITGSWNAGTGTLTLSGTATIAQYQAALRSVTYQNTSNTPNTSVRTVSFTVTDGALSSNTATRTITVAAVNDVPTVANPIADQGATEDSLFSYQFAANVFDDLDGDTLSYSATLSDGSALPAWLSFNAATRTFSGTPANADVGTIAVRVTASDGNGGSVNDTFSVTVANTNDAPTVANAIPDQGATEDAAFSYQFPANTFADVDAGDSLSYSATLSDGSALPSWLSFNAATRTFSGTPANADVGSIAVRVTASDGNGGSVNDTFSVTVANTNDAPTVANAVPDQNATEDAAFSFQFAANTFNDIDVGDSLSYSATLADGSALPGWLSFNAATRTFSGTPTNADVGAISVRVTASDGNGGSVNDTFSTTTANTNDAPTVANPIADQNATEDAAFSFQFASNVFADVDAGDSLTYSATLADGSALPGWLSFNAATRTFSGTPTNGDVGAISVRVTATDGSAASVNDTFTVTVANTNDAPTVANPIADQNATEDAAFSYQFAANVFADVDAGDTLTYSALRGDGSALPAWLSFNAATRTFSGTPTNADVGVLTVRVTADDGNGGTVNDTFTITVANTNDAPTVANPIPDQSTNEDALFSFQFAANGFNDVDTGDSLTYAATLSDGSALPGWLSFNAATRTFSGTPTNAEVGTITVRVTATDGSAASANDTFTITVNNTNDAPMVANPIADQNATEDAAFSFQFAANVFADVDAGDTLSYSATLSDGSALPAWLSFNAATRTFSGTPANADVGSIAVRVTASDGNGGTVNDTFTVTIANTNDAPTVANPIADQNGTEDVAFNFQFASNAFADVDTGDTLTYTATLADGSALPGWLSFNAATRTFSGTPANADVGTISVRVTADDGNGGTVSDTFGVTVANANDAPTVANPIADQSTNEDALLSFQFPANTFNDVDAGDTLTYSATLSDGSVLPAWLSFNAATRTFSGTPTNAEVGTITVRVTATDGSAASVNDTFTITVNNTNDAPTVANAIPDRTATEDAAFSYQFPANTFNDVDAGDTLTYSATLSDGSALPAWLSFNAATRTFSGTPANGDVGAIAVRVTASDGNGGSVNDTFTLTVNNSNDAPTVANPIADQSATEDSAFNFQFAANTFNDVDAGDTLAYAATLSDGSALPSWLSFNATTRTFSGTPLNANVGTITVRVTADDGNGGSVNDTFTITVANTNDAPTVANPIADQSATEDSAFSYQFATNVFADVDAGDTLSYSATLSDGSALPGWLSFNAATRTFSGTPANADVGSIAVRVTASDGNGGTVNDTFTITVNNTNDAPTVANPIADQNATEDSAFSFQFPSNTFADVDAADTLSYSATLSDGSALPGWLSLNAATRTFSGTPLNANVDTITVRVTADDGNGGTVSDTFTITVANTNDAPTVANPIADQNATEDVAYSFQFAANVFADVDAGDSLTYAATLSDGSALPGWLSFDDTTRTFSGTPTNAQVGTITLRVTASDANGGSVNDTFTLTVNNANDAPTVANPIADQTTNEDALFSFQFASNTFNDVDAGDTLSYAATLSDGSALPAWLSFNAATRTFSGTPANGDVGTITVRVTATDSGAATANDAFTITVNNTNDAPTVANPIPDQSATEDVAFNYQFAANTFNDVDAGDTLSYAATLSDGSALPAWLSFNAATRTFSGTPANADVGAISVRVTASDANGGSVNDTFTITVTNANDAPMAANPIPDQNATEDAPFSHQFPTNTFADDDGDPLTYSATLGDGSALPSWLSFNATTRTFSGTPLNANVGTITIRVTAADGNGGSVNDTFTITVANTNDAPTVANAIPDQSTAEDALLSYQFPSNTFADVDAGDTLTYAATLADGSALPAWLSFNVATRTFSGTPTNAEVGSYSVRVTATDGGAATVSDTFTLTVTNTNDGPTVANPIADQNATEDSLFSYQFAANVFADIDTGDTLSYSATLGDGSALPGWLSFNAATRTFSGTPLNANVGTITVRVTADDGNGGSVNDTFTITIANTNDAPTVANPIADQNATEDAAFSFQFATNVFADVDAGDTLTYAATLGDGSALPAWLSFDDATRTFSGTPANADVGSFTVRLTAGDGNGGSVNDTFTVTVANTNDAPTVANPIADQSTAEDAAYSYQFPLNTFADVDAADTLSYAATLGDGSALPAWLSFNAATRTFGGTPLNANVGTITIRVTASDGNGGSVNDTFTLNVTNTNDAPTVANPLADRSATQDVPFSAQFPANTFNDVDAGDTLTYSATLSDGSALPSWLGFNAATRTFSGTPTAGYVGAIAVRVTASDGNGGSVNDTFTLTVNDTNDVPTVANPIPDQSATEDAAFAYQFPANTFNDVDAGDTLTYSATLGDGSALPSWLSFDDATRTFSGTPANGDVGAITVRVTADDGNGGTVNDTFTIAISNTNDAPTVANPIPDRTATEDAAFSYQFPSNTFNDVDAGDSLSYVATLSDGSALPAWLAFDAVTRTFSGTPANGDVGTITVRVTATDGSAASVNDTFTITVNNTNDAPTVANPIADQNATEDSAFSYQFAANVFADIDAGDTLTYSATLSDGSALPSWLSFNAATRTFSGTPTNGDVGSIAVRVTATDGSAASANDTFTLTVANTNDAPTVANPIADQNATEDSAFSFQFPSNSFADVDAGDTLSYSATLSDGSALPGWLSLNAATRTFSGTPVNADVGSYSVRVTASDGNGGSISDTFAITVANTNDAPTVANPIADQNATEDSAFSYQFAANVFADVDAGDVLSYTATRGDGSALPAWLSFNAATRTFSGTPANADVGTVAVRVTADDGNGGTIDDTFTITVANTNDAPTVANTIADQNATEDSAFNYQFASNVFNDVDGDSLTYAATLADGSALPSWLTFNAATRTFSGTPANADVGSYNVRVTASDGNGGSVSDTFAITVANTNDAPTVANPIANQNATEDAPFSYQFPSNTFNDVDAGDTLSYSAQLAGGGALPGWLTFNAATRTFSGTPTNAHVGTISVDVIASDGNGGTVTDTFSVTIANTNDAPTVANPIADQNATEDAPFAHQFAANVFDDVDGDSRSYTATLSDGSALPSWLAFNAASRTFSGTPANGDVGSFSVRVTADDGNGGTVSDTFTVTVANANDAPTVANPIPNQGATEDAPFSYGFPANTFADIDAGDSLTYSAQLSGGGALPSWLSFNAATRTFSGTPANAHVGTVSVDVMADDGNGGTVTDTFTITVANTNDAPTVANAIPDRAATEDAAFSYQFPSNTFNDVDGDALTYTATLSDGSALPAWLSFNAATRTFSGTPANADVGAIALRVTADDGNGGSANDTFTITVANTNDAPTVANPIADQSTAEDAAFSFQFAANTFDDVDGDALTYSATLADGSALPGWLSFNAATRTFSGTPANGDVGAYNIRVTASDGNGGSTSDTFAITVTNTNDAPTVANTIADQNATEDAPFSFQFASNTFADVDAGDILTYAATRSDGSTLPAWLTFNAATSTFSGTPANGDVGTVNVRVTASDGNGGTVSDTFAVTVANTNDAPTVANAIPNRAATQDVLFGYTFPLNTFNDVDAGDTLSYTATLSDGSALPAWLTFNAATRNFSGTPTNLDVGVITIRVTASDGNGGSVNDTFTLTVNNSNDVPTVANPIADQNATEDAPFNFAFASNTFNDGDGDPLTYTATLADGSALPAWLSFDPATRAFSGTPANGDVGTVSILVTADDEMGGIVTDTFSITVANVNDAPTVANPIADQSGTEDVAFSYQFPSNTFNDVDAGDTLSYTATLSDGSALPAWLSFNAATRTFSGTPATGESGSYSVRVTASDGNGGSVSDTFAVTVAAVNDAPTVANPIADQNATEDVAFSLQFPTNTFDDVDAGDVLSYAATRGDGSALPSWLTFNAATRTFSGTPTNGDVGTLTVRVTVDDGNGGAVSDTFTVTIANSNDAPTVANPIADQSATEDVAFNYQFPSNTFSEVDAGDTLTYSATRADGSALPAWLSFDAVTRTFSGTPANGDVGSFSVRVTADDGNGATVSDTFAVTVANANDAPTVANPIADQAATEDAPFNYQFPVNTFADVDAGDSLTYTATLADGSALPAWLSFNAATRAFSGTPANGDVGAISVRVTATDGSAATASDTFTITVGNTNDAPTVANPIADQSATEEIGFNFQFPANTFADVDAGATLAYSATLSDGSALPAWLSFNAATRTFSGTPTNSDVGAVSVRVTADDGNGGTVTDTFTITVNNTNDAPTVANPVADQNATEDAAFSYQFPSNTFNDVDAGDTLSYFAQLAGGGALPSWLSFNAATRTFSGTPTNAHVGTISLELIANDGNGGTATDTFSVTIANTNDAPTVANPIADAGATQDVPFSLQFALNTFDDVDAGDTLSYAATLSDGSALPAWLSFNAATRTFSGTPGNTDVGSYAVRVTASDGNGGSASDTFTITVSNANDVPTVVNPIADQNATEDAPFGFQFPSNTFDDGDADPLTYSATLADGSALPAWLSFNATTRTFSGTPANGDVGAISVRVTASDGQGGSVSDTFSVTVANTNDAPTVANPIVDQGATEDVLLSFQLPANTFGDVDAGDTLTYAATLADGSALPAWLTFNAVTRTFSGTPANGDVGSYTVRVTATDGSAATASDTFALTVANANDAPTVANVIGPQWTPEDAPFSFQFPANTFADIDGDALSYTATLADGSALPAWLSFNGATRTFSGTPTNAQVGAVPVRVTASDGNGGSASDTFPIHIDNTNDAPTVANPMADQNAMEASPFTFQFPLNTFDDVDLGDTLSYSATLADGSALPAWLSFNAAARRFTGTPANGDVGTLSIRVTAADGNGGSGSDTFTLTVANLNEAPTVANPVPDQNATEDAAFSYQFPSNTFADTDAGDVLTYTAIRSDGSALPGWLTFNAATRTFSGTPANGDVGTLTVRLTADDGNGGTVNDTFTITIANTNDAPTVANPIADQNAIEDALFSFQFPSNTFADVDAGDSITYAATRSDGSALPAWLSFDAATRTFTGTPANGDVGTVTVRVTASDANGGAVNDTFTITVANTNDGPTVANPIPDRTATEDTLFSYQFPSNTFNDADAGDTLTYAATLADGSALPAWLSFNAATRTFSGTPANGDVGAISVRVTATDGSAATASDTFTVTVVNTNDAPTVATPIPDQSATEDAAFTYQVLVNAFADVDGDALTYAATRGDGSALPAWLTFDAATRTFSGTPANGDVGTLTVRVTASDGNGGSTSDTFAITVANANDGPTVANPIADRATNEDAPFTFQIPSNAFADVDAGDTLTYSATLSDGSALPGWLSFNAATRTFSGTPANGDVGAIAIRVTVSDGNGGSATDTFVITVNNTNDAPTVAIPIGNQSATEDAPFSFQFTAGTFADVDGDALSYTATRTDGSALPAWLSFNSVTRTFSGSPTNSDVGSVTIRVTASDGNGGAGQATFTVTVGNTNDAPVVANPIVDAVGPEDGAFNYQLPADAFDDVDAADTLTYAATMADGSPLPGWLTFDAATRTFTGTPTSAEIGSYDVRVTATDGSAASASDTFTIVVVNSNDAPIVANPFADRSAIEDSPFNATVPLDAFDDEDGDALTYSATLADGSPLPAWLSFDAATRTFSGSPPDSAVGTIVIRIQAADGHGGTASSTFSLAVTNTNDTPNLAAVIQDLTVAEGRAFEFQIPAGAFTDPDGDALEFAATLADGSPLPAWLTFDAQTRTFAGTPQATEAGALSIRVTATDPSGAAVSATFSITVSSDPSTTDTEGGVRAGNAEPFSMAIPDGVLRAVERELERAASNQRLEVGRHAMLASAPWLPPKIKVTPGFGVLPFTLADVTLEAEASTGAEMMELDVEPMLDEPADPALQDEAPHEGVHLDLDGAIQSSAVSRPEEATPVVRVAATVQFHAKALRDFAAHTFSSLLGTGGIAASMSPAGQSSRGKKKPTKKPRRR